MFVLGLVVFYFRLSVFQDLVRGFPLPQLNSHLPPTPGALTGRILSQVFLCLALRGCPCACSSLSSLEAGCPNEASPRAMKQHWDFPVSSENAAWCVLELSAFSSLKVGNKLLVNPNPFPYSFPNLGRKSISEMMFGCKCSRRRSLSPGLLWLFLTFP